MKARFWGVRGSYPVAGPGTVRYGGNTSCIEVRLDDGTLIILDAGSGLRNLGAELMNEERFSSGDGRATVLITHTHWDHIMGMPYFAPANVAGNQFDIYARKNDYSPMPLDEVFRGQQVSDYCDSPFGDFRAEFGFHEILEGDMIGANSASISTARLNHPCYALGYRIVADGCTLTYITDTSPYTDLILGLDFAKTPAEVTPPEGSPRWAEMSRLHDGVLELMRDADLVIYDTFFEPEGFARAPHWGHSTPDHAITDCSDAGAKRLALFHHAPDVTDEQMDGFEEKYRLRGGESKVDVFASREGLEVTVGG